MLRKSATRRKIKLHRPLRARVSRRAPEGFGWRSVGERSSRTRASSRVYEILSPMTTRPPRSWRVGDQALLAGERVTFMGYIDHGGPGPFDEVLVEFANGEERTVFRDALCPLPDLVQGVRATGEVYLAGGRLDPAESLAVAAHSPEGFWWGNVGPAPRSSASPCCCGPRTATPRSPTTWRSPGRSSPACPGRLRAARGRGARLAGLANASSTPTALSAPRGNPRNHGRTPLVSQSPGSSCAADRRSRRPPRLAQAPRRTPAGDGPRPGEA